MRKILTTKKVSEALNVSEETVRRWIRSGQLKAKQNGKSYLIEKSELVNLAKKQSNMSGTTIAKINAMAGAAGSTIDKIIDSIGKKEQLEEIPGETAPSLSLYQINNEIEKLKRQKKRLELEHQMKLLELDEEIAQYEELKNENQGGTPA